MSVLTLKEDKDYGLLSNFSDIDKLFVDKGVFLVEHSIMDKLINLKEIEVHPNNPNYYSEGNCLISKTHGTVLKACSESIIPTDKRVKNIGPHAFANITVNEINIPNNIAKIWAGAIHNCNVKRLTIPFIGEHWNAKKTGYLGHIFGANNILENIKFVPKSLKTVEITGGHHLRENAFFECKYLEEVILHPVLNRIEDYAFSGCKNLKKVTLLKYQIPNFYDIGINVFVNCDKIKFKNGNFKFLLMNKAGDYIDPDTLAFGTETTVFSTSDGRMSYYKSFKELLGSASYQQKKEDIFNEADDFILEFCEIIPGDINSEDNGQLSCKKFSISKVIPIYEIFDYIEEPLFSYL